MSCYGRRPRVSNWGYVAIAYTVVWGGLALYGLLMARRVAQAQRVSERLRGMLRRDRERG